MMLRVKILYLHKRLVSTFATARRVSTLYAGAKVAIETVL